jgi:hypothetical protein
MKHRKFLSVKKDASIHDIINIFIINSGDTDSSDADSDTDTKDVGPFVSFRSPIVQVRGLMFSGQSVA